MSSYCVLSQRGKGASNSMGKNSRGAEETTFSPRTPGVGQLRIILGWIQWPGTTSSVRQYKTRWHT